MFLPHLLPHLPEIPQWLVDLFLFHLFYGFDARRWRIGSGRNRGRNELRRKLRWCCLGNMALELAVRQVVVEQMASELPVKLVELLVKLVVDAFFATARIGGVSYYCNIYLFSTLA